MSNQEVDQSRTAPTLSAVAKLAGVSSITVSRVVRLPNLVARETRDRVEAAMRELGYVPNQLAGALASARTRSVGVLVPTIANSIFARIGMSQLEVGWLLHEIRDQKMFSRFWIGGRFGQVRGLGRVGAVLARAIGRFVQPGESFARDLLVHCSQEMSHLGSFLPSIHQELGHSL